MAQIKKVSGSSTTSAAAAEAAAAAARAAEAARRAAEARQQAQAALKQRVTATAAKLPNRFTPAATQTRAPAPLHYRKLQELERKGIDGKLIGSAVEDALKGLQGPFNKQPETPAQALERRSPAYATMPPEQQAQAEAVYASSDATGRQRLVDLMNQDCTTLLIRDTEGETLLQNLSELALQEMDPALAESGVTRESLLASVMTELTPGMVNQDGHGTCTVTSAQYMLVSQNPSEYVRIMEGLLSPSGSATLASGVTVDRDDASIAPDSSTSRSGSERIFQAAMMQYAKGGEEGDYDNVEDKLNGLNKDDQERMLEALFGAEFDAYDGSFNFNDDREDMRRYVEEHLPGQVYTSMEWGDGGHAVVIEEIRDGRVYFRNPWGPNDSEPGHVEHDPERRIEDPETGLESMTVEEYQSRVTGVFVATEDSPVA